MAVKAKIEKKFKVTAGFNIPDPDSKDGGELRFEVDTPVDPKDFDPAVWKDLVDAGAIAEVAADKAASEG